MAKPIDEPMPAVTMIPVQIARGFGAQGVLPAQSVDMPAALPSAPGQPPSPAPWAQAQASAPAVYLGPARPDPQQDAPVLVAALKLMAVLVGLGGAYLAALFLLGAPEAPPEHRLRGPATALVAPLPEVTR